MLAGLFATVLALAWVHHHHALAQLVGAAAGGVAFIGGASGPSFSGPPRTFLRDTWQPTTGIAVVAGTGLNVTATTTTVQDLVINGTCTGCPVATPTQLDPAIFTEGRIYSVGAATVLAADTFTGANTGNINGRTTTTGAKTWVTAVGTSTHALVGISSNKAINAGALANYANAIIDTGAVDGVVTMTVSNKGTGVSHQGILFRCDAAADCLWAGWYNGACYGVGHSTKGVGDGTVYVNDGCVNSLNNGDVLSVSYSGNVINFYRNSVLLLTTTQSQNNAQTHAGLCTGGGSVTPQFDDWSVQTVAVPVGLVVQGNYSTSDVSKIILGENAPGIAMYDKGAQLLTLGFPDVASDYLSVWDPNFPLQTSLTYFDNGDTSTTWKMTALNNAGNETASVTVAGDTGIITLNGRVFATADVEADSFVSTVATGTAPAIVASTTKVTNLNCDLLDGLTSADFFLAGHAYAAVATLDGGGGATPVVISGSLCTCTDATAVQPVKCHVTGTVLSISGTAGDDVTYTCIH